MMAAATKKLTSKSYWANFFSTLKYSLYVIFHPFDGFWDLIHEKRGSIGAANFIVIMVLLTRLLSLEHTSFLFMRVYWPKVNILQQCMSVLLPLGIYCVCNWGLTTLFEGKGTLKNVYMGTAYALTPFVLINLPLIPFSNMVTAQEGAIYTLLSGVALVWCAMLIICAMMMIHDYALGKTLLFTFMTLIAMLVVIFLMLLFFTLVGDGVGYFVSLYKQVVFRLY